MTPIHIKQLTPATAIHPGEILMDELQTRGITQKEFARLIGMQPTQLNEIIKGKRGVNAALALLIGTALKTEPQIWLNLQSNYELDLAKTEKGIREKLQAIEQWHKKNAGDK